MTFCTRLLALCLLPFAAHAQNLSIATGGTGGVYYPLGGGMAAVLSKYVQGMQATAEVTGGSVANLQLISTGKPYLAMTMVDAGLDALKGQDKFTGKPVPVRTLMVMYPNRMHVVTMEGMGISKIDAFFWVGGLPTAAVSDLANSPGVKIKMIDHADLVDKMNQKYGKLYVQDRIPKETYKGMDADNKQATVMNLLVAHQNMDEKTAYNIVKAVFDHRDELIRVHKEAENFKLENQKTAAAGGIPARCATSRRRASRSTSPVVRHEKAPPAGAFSLVGG